jgi:hypothetical protein
MTIGHIYAKGQIAISNKEVDLNDGNVKVALATSSYTPDLIAHDYFDDVTNEVSGTGYTAGGKALSNVTITVTAADSWSIQRADSTAYAVGDVVRPATGNGHLYRCIVAGTTASSPPTFPTVSGQTVTDGTVTWAEYGTSFWQFDADDVVWTSSTITARYAIVYYSTGVASTSPLLSLLDFESNQSSSSGDFRITWHALGILTQAMS